MSDPRRNFDRRKSLAALRKACGGEVRGYDRGGPYTYDPPKQEKLSILERILQAADTAPQVGLVPSVVPKSILKTAAGMLGTYNPESDRLELGMRPGLIDEIIGLPATVDSVAALMGKETNLAGDTSKTAAALADASHRRINRVAPARSKGESALQGLSDALVSVPGTQPAKVGKVARAVTALPRAVYDTVVPVMDLSTKTGKAVAGGTGALGAGLGAFAHGQDEDVDFFTDLGAQLGATQPGTEDDAVDALIAKAQGGDRAAYEELKRMFPGELQ